MTSLTHQIARERRALAEARSEGFMDGVIYTTTVFCVLLSVCVLLLLLVMGAGK